MNYKTEMSNQTLRIRGLISLQPEDLQAGFKIAYQQLLDMEKNNRDATFMAISLRMSELADMAREDEL